MNSNTAACSGRLAELGEPLISNYTYADDVNKSFNMLHRKEVSLQTWLTSCYYSTVGFLSVWHLYPKMEHYQEPTLCIHTNG